MRLRLLALAISLLLPSIALGALVARSVLVTADVDIARIPRSLGGWFVAAEDALAMRVEEMLKPDSYVFRRYDAHGRSIWAFISLYRQGPLLSAEDAHSPEVCYPAQGFVITRQTTVRIRTETGSFPAQLLRGHRDGAVEHVLYWFQPASRWPGNPLLEELFRVWDQLLGAPQYAFVRLSMTDGSEGSGTEDSRIDDLAALGTMLAPHVRAALNAQ